MSLSVSLIQSPNNSSKSAINLVDKGLYATMNRWRIDPFSYYMMSSGRSILASSLLYSIILCFIIIVHKDNLSER